MPKDPPRTTAGPKYAHAEVARLVPNLHIVSNAVRDVRMVLGCDDREARAYIKAKLMTLGTQRYYKRYSYPDGKIDDSYSVRDAVEDLEWFVKLRIEGGEQLLVTTFHVPEHPMKSGGRHA